MTNFGAFIDPLPVSDTVERAKFLEKNDYDSLWLSDETQVFASPKDMTVPELFPTLTMIAANTSKIKIGTGVIDASIRHPAKLSQSIATVDAVSNGRLLIGIGGGELANRQMYGIESKNLFSKMNESVKVIKLLLQSNFKNIKNFKGNFYSLDNAFLKISSVTKPHPPIIVSAFGPKALHLTGEEGDGWISFAHTPESFDKTYNRTIKNAAEKCGRNLESIDPYLVIPVGLHKESKKTEQIISSITKDWLVWSPDNMKLITPQISHSGLRQPYLKRSDGNPIEELQDFAKQIPDETALDMAINGTKEECIEKLSKFIKAGCKNFTCYIVPIEKSWHDAIKEFKQEVVSYFK